MYIILIIGIASYTCPDNAAVSLLYVYTYSAELKTDSLYLPSHMSLVRWHL